VKLITWNVQWGCGMDGRVDFPRIVATAREMADFDVLCVQEIAANFPGLQGNDTRDQFAELGVLLPGFTCAAAFGVDIPGDGGKRCRFGNAIYSRYSIRAIRRHTLPWPVDAGKRSMPRVAIEAFVQTPLGTLRVTTSHLEYYSEIQRAAQAAALRALHDEACARAASPPAESASDGTPFGTVPQAASAILTGDFNFRPEHAPYDDMQQPLASGGPRYIDAWRALRQRAPHPPTFCIYDRRYSREPYCCDFIFVSEDLRGRLRRIEVNTETQASDHQPVLLEVDDL
jgi:endonuclease/exonuclease/phosphatase family metal-dependent hydrolase